MLRAFIFCSIAATFFNPALAARQTAATDSAAAQPGAATQASENLAVVDLVVTDAGRHPIHNLRASDFRLLEDNHPQAIKSFEEHYAWEAAAPLPASPGLSAGTFSNFTVAPVHGALNILVLDVLNAPAAERSELRSRMVRYLQQVHPGTHIAILGLTTRMILLQGFTSDPQLVSSVLAAKDDSPTPGAASDAAAIPDDAPRASLGNNPSAAQVQAGLQQFMVDLSTLPFQARARYTLDAFNQLARSFGALPGRKNVIWFSSAFPINLMPDGEQPTPFAAVATAEDEYRQTVNLLARGQVAVYPIDARDNAVAQSAAGPNPNAKYIRGPVSHSHTRADLYQLTAEEPGAMQTMAEATGGEPIALTSELKDAVERAIDRGSSYYTLTYVPADTALNGAYHKIRMDAATQGLVLAYRRGYFADDPKAAPAPVEQMPVNAESTRPYSAIDAAMALAAPVPTEIIVAATVAPLSSGQSAGAAGNEKSGGLAGSPFRRYSIQLGIEARNIVCPATLEGSHQCTLDLSIAAYDASGASINLAGGSIQASITADQYDATMASGLSFHQDVSIPVASAIFLRVGVRDHATGRVGAVEIPLAGLINLPSASDQPQSKAQPQDHERAQPLEQH